MRMARVERDTLETKIRVFLNIDEWGETSVNTGCGFLDHMLTLFAFHAGFTLNVDCVGDVNVDDHHTVEDVAASLGEALDCALEKRAGIARYGQSLLPMDESLVLCALDLSGRAYAQSDLAFETEKIGTFDTQLIDEFFHGFARAARVTLHLQKLAGKNSHHIAEAAFKAFARAAREAVMLTEMRGVPSSKGMLV